MQNFLSFNGSFIVRGEDIVALQWDDTDLQLHVHVRDVPMPFVFKQEDTEFNEIIKWANGNLDEKEIFQDEEVPPFPMPDPGNAKGKR